MLAFLTVVVRFDGLEAINSQSGYVPTIRPSVAFLVSCYPSMIVRSDVAAVNLEHIRLTTTFRDSYAFYPTLSESKFHHT